MTFGHRPILPWEVITFLKYALIAIEPNAARHPHSYIPNDNYIYHRPHELGAVSVLPSPYKRFTWSDLYLVVHALAEYIVASPRAYEMCVEIRFHKGGSAGLMFLEWWTWDVPTIRSSPHDRQARDRRLIGSDS